MTIAVKPRPVIQVVRGLETSDGAGVHLTRVIGGPSLPMLDPFLLLDDFRSDDPQDYIAGFPAHPNRGFETVTYLLAGRMRHRDSAGHGGVIEAGGVQWMTAGRGIVHSEMPEQENGQEFRGQYTYFPSMGFRPGFSGSSGLPTSISRRRTKAPLPSGLPVLVYRFIRTVSSAVSSLALR